MTAVEELEAAYPLRKFTPDGHLVGSISLYSTCDRLVVLRVVSPEEAEIVYDGVGKTAWERAGAMGKNGQRRISFRRLTAIAADLSDSK